MLESRAAYGYYGEGYGVSGEQPPKEHYTIQSYYFLIDWHDPRFSNCVSVKAKNFKNAIRQAKAWAKRDGGTFLGEDPDRAIFNH